MNRFKFVVDNLGGNTVGGLLKTYLKPSEQSSFATAYFTVSGFDIVADNLEKTKNFRLLLGSEPGTDPLRNTILDIWKNIDIRDSSKQAERSVTFFQRPDVKIRLHPGPFFHGKTYILNHPDPIFDKIANDDTRESSLEKSGRNSEEHIVEGRIRPSTFIFKGKFSELQNIATAIVGSSNFTYGGLTKNTELNLFDPIGASLIELLTWYQERWDISKDFKEDFIKVLKGYYKPFDPFWIYAKALYELYKDDLGIEKEEKPGSIIELADFQRAGYRSAVRILNQWNAVLIADAPGLGKTYMAGKILEDFAYTQRQFALIICPAEVESIWDSFTRAEKIPVKKILHTEVLGRGMREGDPKIEPSDYKNCSFILVDESHHFRNPDTGRYQWLQQLLAMPKPQIKIEGQMRQIERKVVFVTATPVNNSVWDLYWQLRLLFGEKVKDVAFRQGITELGKYFEATERGKGNLYDFIEKVAVRRSRAFIREHYPNATLDGKPVKFPIRELDNIPYSLHENLGNLYEDAANTIERLALVPYCLESYCKCPKDETKILRGELLSTLFRVLILKRLESSLNAFRISTSRLQKLFELFLKMLQEGKILESRDLREYITLAESAEEDGINAEITEILQTALSPDDFYIERMKVDIQNDITAISGILKNLPEKQNELITLDNKYKEVSRWINYNKKKMLIFTSFMDTATYLFNFLKTQEHRIGLVTGDKCKLWTGSETINTKRGNLIKWFSPHSNNARIKKGEEIDILIATDVFSEAINLQDANIVLNYDLPWNPMKLVQRAGRVDRMGSQHPTVLVLNVFPEKGLETLLKLMKRLQNKITQTHRAVGLEWSLLGEQPITIDFVSTIERVKKKDVGVLTDIEKNMEALIGLDPQEQLLAILQTLSKEDIEKIPDGAGSVTSIKQSTTHKPGFFVAYRRKHTEHDVDQIWRFYPETGGNITNKTEIIQPLQFPRSYPSLKRFDENTLSLLRNYRITLENEMQATERRQRTEHISGYIRKAFELTQRKGRSDLYLFIQKSWKKGAIERALRKIPFKNEEKALKIIEALMKRFGSSGEQIDPTQVEPISVGKEPLKLPVNDEIAPFPKERDPRLELVCWMHITSGKESEENIDEKPWTVKATGQKKFRAGKISGQSKLVQ